eukprot:5080156-Prymnesium_polylepis.1
MLSGISALCATAERKPAPAPQSLGLIGDTDSWLAHLQSMARARQSSKDDTLHAARVGYLRFLMGALSGLTLSCEMTAPADELAACAKPFRDGSQWTVFGATMAGQARMESMMWMVQRIIELGLRGSYVEAGVWRGGMSVFAKAALHAFGLHDRPVYLCDSFQGLPLPRNGSGRADETWYRRNSMFRHALSIREQEVLANFDRYGVSRNAVRSHRGWFVDSLPLLRAELLARGERLSLLRMDGDIYDSTVDILYNLYDLLEVGGMLTIDDYGWGARGGQRGSKKGLRQPS